MDFVERMECRASGMTRDEVVALEISWDRVSEPLAVLLSSDGRTYVDGELTDSKIIIEDGVAWIGDTPVVVTIPREGGGFMYHPDFGPDSVDEYREQIFQDALEEIKQKKWAEPAQPQPVIEVPETRDVPTESISEFFAGRDAGMPKLLKTNSL
jgi:hypothetical protein